MFFSGVKRCEMAKGRSCIRVLGYLSTSTEMKIS
jgi:hypothetical protein